MNKIAVRLDLGDNLLTLVDPDHNILCTMLVTLGDDPNFIEVTPIELFSVNVKEDTIEIEVRDNE